MSKLGWECSLFWLLIYFHCPKVRPRWEAKMQTFLSDRVNPTHQIPGAFTPKSPLYVTATQIFPLLSSCGCCVRLWREATWGCEGGVTSTRRAWCAMGGFLSHGRSRCLLCHANQCGTDSWVTFMEKTSVFCLQKITLLSPLPNLAVTITMSEASLISSYLSFLHERIMVPWHCFFLAYHLWCVPFLAYAAKQ